jgi:hypothetical protein
MILGMPRACVPPLFGSGFFPCLVPVWVSFSGPFVFGGLQAGLHFFATTWGRRRAVGRKVPTHPGPVFFWWGSGRAEFFCYDLG